LECRRSRTVEYWAHWEGQEKEGTFRNVKELYIYSPLDQLCDVNKLEQLIAIRRQRISQVTAVRFEDTDHVTHLRKRPAEYAAACLAFCGLA